jgi:hypothetical protein
MKLNLMQKINYLISLSAEHVFFLATVINDNHLQIKYCSPRYQNFWMNFLSRYRPHLVHFFPYSPFELPLYEVSYFIQRKTP